MLLEYYSNSVISEYTGSSKSNGSFSSNFAVIYPSENENIVTKITARNSKMSSIFSLTKVLIFVIILLVRLIKV